MSAPSPPTDCPLCRETGGHLVFQAPHWRLIRADEPNFPAFYRLIWQAHVAEFSDLPPPQRQACMEAVCAVEQVLRDALQPTKINVASLGNVVPHLHWHVIARFDWDSHFPNPVWGQAVRQLPSPAVQRLAIPLAELDQRLAHRLQAMPAQPAP
ncbi:HIT family protein [Pelomonas sp. APW6]|uniref:HIT family protein n=1 Tax=Roseateles subflavus TaxID=3053353 RepID=A0ABT7LJB0_9BURK|nr:HIT family protein [Pelomonas sp. APW6]MDL5032946.1 HIT family protein [Pelomonas sp. APW6]